MPSTSANVTAIGSRIDDSAPAPSDSAISAVATNSVPFRSGDIRRGADRCAAPTFAADTLPAADAISSSTDARVATVAAR
jgi:hypothetical protein